MKITEYTKQSCPICNHTGWCGRREDGLILCKRPPSPAEVPGYTYKGLGKDDQTAMYVEAGREHKRNTPPPPPVRSKRPASPLTLKESHKADVEAFTSELRSDLAAELGLPGTALAELDIGWSDAARHHSADDLAGAYVFPEYNGQGRLIGSSYRFPAEKVSGRTDANGKPLSNKSSPAGLQRGVVLPLAWKDMSDPMLIVEGPSDVLAGRAVGLSVIGRPNNYGGVNFIAQMCRRRQVIVIGENDRKPDGLWPGKEGAEHVSRRLEIIWGRPVPVAFPPEGIKDLRDWVGQLVPDWQKADIEAVRDTILNAIRPPELLLMARPTDRGRRLIVKVFRRDDGVEAIPIHSDRIRIEDAAARKRFAKAVVKVEPEADVDDLQRRLLGLKVPTTSTQKSPEISAPGDHVPSEDTADSPDEDQLPTVFLPGGPMPITKSALIFGSLLSKTDKYYLRGCTVATIAEDKDGKPIIETVKPAALASVFETVASLMEYTKLRGQFVPQRAVCSEQNAKLIQHSAAFQDQLPPIHLLSRCPVLIERDGELVEISGYDRDSGILAFGEPAADVSLDEAINLLAQMLADFHFASSSDRARALAAIITPALVFGELLKGRAPIDLGEADCSQAGKGFRAKLTAAVYNHIVKTVTQKKGGVGSMEESFATALTQGYAFVSFDNVRQQVDSPALESFMTEDSYLARVPHQGAIEIDPRRVIVQFTSNKAEITPDLANRCSCVRILKQSADYQFRQYAEGDILEHVRTNQPLYLGAAFTIIKAWYAAGKPSTKVTSHDFRRWARVLDWISQNVLDAGPLLEGHRDTQMRMSTPHLNWLRDVALAVRNKGQLDMWLRASDLVEIISDMPELELPGLPEGADLTNEDIRKKVLQAVGRRLAHCFGPKDVRIIDGFEITRQETKDPDRLRFHRKYYFSPIESAAYTDQSHRRCIGQAIGGKPPKSPSAAPQSSSQAEQDGTSVLCAAALPPMRRPIETAFLPIPSYTSYGSVIVPPENKNTHVFENTCEINAVNKNINKPIGRIGRPGGNGQKPIYNPDEDEVLI